MSGDSFYSRYLNELTLAGVLFFFLIVMSIQVTTPDGSTLAQRFVHQAVSPVLWVLDSSTGGVRRVFYEYADFRGVVEENRELKDKLRVLEIKALRSDSVESNYEVLKELLGYRASLPLATLSAHVVSRDVNEPWRMAALNRGKRDGLAFGQAVLSPQGVVGRIRATTLTSAQVQLITDSRSALAVSVLPGRYLALAVGKGKKGILLKFIDPEAAVEVGNIVVTSGDEGIYPPGYPLGRVRALEDVGGTGLERKIWVTPSVEIDRLSDVLVAVALPEEMAP